MSRRPLLIGSIALVLAALAGGIGWYGGRTSHPLAADAADDEGGPRPALTDATLTAPATASAPGQRPPDRPLPPLDQPLRNVFAELKQRADAGEAAASCRLAAELDFCAQIGARLASASDMLRQTGEDGPTMRVGRTDDTASPEEQRRQAEQALMQHSERLLQESAHCEGVPDSTPVQRVQYWRSAALGGNATALRMYATGNVFRQDSVLDQLDALRIYRGEAETLALRAARSGDRMVTMALGHAYSPTNRQQRRFLLSQAIEPDGARALAFYLHAQSQMPAPPNAAGPNGQRRPARRDDRLAREIRELETQLDAGSLARARQLAADMTRNYAPAVEPRMPARTTGDARTPNASLRDQCDTQG